MTLLSKYHPKSLDELPLSDKLIKTLKKITQFKGGVYIFYSPPGTGKSTACNIIMKNAIKVLGSANVMPPINGSFENTVDIVVGKIQPFVSKAPRRLIVIEEADKLTKEMGKGKGAQEALKDLTTRTLNRVTWIFVTNHIEEIIQPLRDRATIIEFKPEELKMLEILKKINDQEKLNYSVKELHSIIKTSYPSIRNAILKLEGVEVRQFDESRLMKDIQRLISNKISPKVFCEQYKTTGLATIIRSLVNIGDQYFDDQLFTKILIISSYISEIKDEHLAFTTYVYLLNQLSNDDWTLPIDTICSTTISIKAISARYYQKLQDFSSKKSKRK
jgi:DNA polymerase III delta prime subunit